MMVNTVKELIYLSNVKENATKIAEKIGYEVINCRIKNFKKKIFVVQGYNPTNFDNKNAIWYYNSTNNSLYDGRFMSDCRKADREFDKM